MKKSPLRAAFTSLPPVARRDRRIATLKRRVAELGQDLASGDQLTRPA